MLLVCPYALQHVRQTGEVHCLEPLAAKRFDIPLPIVTGHPDVAGAR